MSYEAKLISFNQRPDYKQECRELFRVMGPKPDDRILDVGCGLDGMIDLFRENGLDIFGIDPNQKLLSKLAYNKTAVAYGETLPFGSNTFSAVYFMHSFAHLKNPLHALQEADRVIQPNGKLVIITPNSQFENLIRPVKRILELVRQYESDKTVVQHYSPKELADIVSNFFNITELYCIGKARLQRILLVARPKY